MKGLSIRSIRTFLRDQSGQSAIVMAGALVAVMALGAAGIETGHVYYAYRLLQSSTQAAGLAGAQAMPDITQATAYVTEFSSETGQKNATNLLQSVAITSTFYCSSTVSGTLNVGCQSPPSGEGSCSGSATSCNALKVVQTAQVNLWFGGLVGIPTFNLSAEASAAMRGGTSIPYNIALIIDTTKSMADDTAPASDGCGSDATQIVCAVSGFKTLLEMMNPCALNTTCTSSTPYVDGVALFVFPAVAGAPSSTGVAGDAGDDTTCPTKNPSTVPYNFVDVTSTPSTSRNLNLETSGTNAGSYEVVSFNDTYKANDSTTTLSSSDPLGVAAGGGGGTCKGLQAPGGEATYYAQVIYAAQAALVAQQISYPGSQNIMIILSDGNATACASGANTSDDACSGSDIVAMNCQTPGGSGCAVSSNASSNTSPPLNGTGTSTTNPLGYNIATYPSALGECGQAVQAAQSATAAGTKVYTVAMGSETSGGCLSDQKVTLTGLSNGAVTWPTGSSYPKEPCNAIGAMASNVNTFFSDNTAGCAATGGNVNYTTMAQIFQAIGNNLTAARLIPNGD